MITVALLSQKGGALKTTLSISLACAGVKVGKETLLIDLDPQATACKWGDRRNAEAPIVIDAQPARLANALQKAKEGGIQLVVIDTPPRSPDVRFGDHSQHAGAGRYGAVRQGRAADDGRPDRRAGAGQPP
jgi:cellulose biosynthesis protein BcsQ